MAPYSMDLRSRVLADCDAGVGAKEVAARFRVSRSWVNRAVQRCRETGKVGPRPQTVFKKQAFAGQEDRLHALVDAQPPRGRPRVQRGHPPSRGSVTANHFRKQYASAAKPVAQVAIGLPPGLLEGLKRAQLATRCANSGKFRGRCGVRTPQQIDVPCHFLQDTEMALRLGD